MNSAGNSSIASGTRYSGRDALERGRPHLDVRDRLGARRAMVHDPQVRAHQAEDVEQAGARRVDAHARDREPRPADRAPATMKNADDEKSPGTSSEHASRRCGGVRRISPCAALERGSRS